MTLHCSISSTELLELYGYEPYDDSSVSVRWRELCKPWTPAASPELGHLRQVMLQIHQECDPDDERWR